jgi:hypothetical protein
MTNWTDDEKKEQVRLLTDYPGSRKMVALVEALLADARSTSGRNMLVLCRDHESLGHLFFLIVHSAQASDLIVEQFHLEMRMAWWLPDAWNRHRDEAVGMIRFENGTTIHFSLDALSRYEEELCMDEQQGRWQPIMVILRTGGRLECVCGALAVIVIGELAKGSDNELEHVDYYCQACYLKAQHAPIDN